MAYKRIIIALLLGVVIFNSSCSPYRKLRKDFNRNKTSLSYLHTANTRPTKGDGKIAVGRPVITSRKLPVLGEVKKIKNEVAPMIIYTQWKHEYECAIGKEQIREELSSFVRNSFLEESRRNGAFEADTLSGEGLRLEIEIDSIGAKGPYVNSGFFLYLFFAAFYEFKQTAGPGMAWCRFHYKVKKGETVLLEKYISNHSSLEQLRFPTTSHRQFHEFYRANLVESMGDAIKRNTEELVRHLNLFFEEGTPVPN